MTRKPLELFHKFPIGEKIVGMVLYRDKIMIATENALYESDAETITPIEVKLVPPEPIKYEMPNQDLVVGGLVQCEYCPKMHPVGYICTAKEEVRLDD